MRKRQRRRGQRNKRGGGGENAVKEKGLEKGSGGRGVCKVSDGSLARLKKPDT